MDEREYLQRMEKLNARLGRLTNQIERAGGKELESLWREAVAVTTQMRVMIDASRLFRPEHPDAHTDTSPRNTD